MPRGCRGGAEGVVRGFRLRTYLRPDSFNADVRSPGTSKTHSVCEIRGGTNLADFLAWRTIQTKFILVALKVAERQITPLFGFHITADPSWMFPENARQR